MQADVRAELHAAVEVARTALANFNAEPMVDSKRGGQRLSPWWRVYVQASEVAARWYRQLDQGAARSIDDELDRLLGPE